MIEMLLGLGLIAIIFLGIIILIKIIDKITDYYYKKKREKFEKQFPEYIRFLYEYDILQQASRDIWNSVMPQCKQEVEHCLEEMKYYPEHSEKYQYYKNRLIIARCSIDKCQEDYDKKQNQILTHLKNNKKVIESIKEVRPQEYERWINNYQCLQ